VRRAAEDEARLGARAEAAREAEDRAARRRAEEEQRLAAAEADRRRQEAILRQAAASRRQTRDARRTRSAPASEALRRRPGEAVLDRRGSEPETTWLRVKLRLKSSLTVWRLEAQRLVSRAHRPPAEPLGRRATEVSQELPARVTALPRQRMRARHLPSEIVVGGVLLLIAATAAALLVLGILRVAVTG
jgi:hypothetical protein